MAQVIDKSAHAARKLLIDWRPSRGEIVACLFSGVAVLALTIGTARQLLHDASNSASEAVKAETSSDDQS